MSHATDQQDDGEIAQKKLFDILIQQEKWTPADFEKLASNACGTLRQTMRNYVRSLRE